MIRLQQFINAILYILGFVLVTKTYVVFAYYLSIPMSAVSGFFVFVCLFLCGFKINSYKKFISTSSGLGVLFLIVLGPFITVLTSLRFDVTSLFLQFFYLCIALVGFSYIKEIHKQRSFLLYGMYFNLIAGILTMSFPDLFQNFSKIVDAKETYYGRAVGFYLQPNSFGLATILIYCLSSLLYPKTYITKFFFPCAFTILISGSRSSLVIFIGIAGIQYISNLLSRRGDKNQQKKIFRISLISTGVLACMVIIFLNSNLQKNEKLKQLTERLEFYVSAVQQLEKIGKDGSARDRDNYQKRYKEKISKNPLFGHGFGIQKKDVENGVLIGSSHNEYLSVLYQGGLLYLFTHLIFIMCLIFSAFQIKKYNYTLFISFLIFGVYIIIYGFMINTMFSQRLIYLFLGLIVAYQHNLLIAKKTINYFS